MWLAHSYTVAVSKLETTFSEFSPTVVKCDEMPLKMRTRALAVIAVGQALIAPFLLRPSRICSRFHPCSNLIFDHNKFNLKPVKKIPHARDDSEEPEIEMPKRGSQISKSSPAKKAKSSSKSSKGDEEMLVSLRRCEADLAKAKDLVSAFQTKADDWQARSSMSELALEKLQQENEELASASNYKVGSLKEQLEVRKENYLSSLLPQAG